MSKHIYSEEEENFIKANAGNLTRKCLAKLFNETFNTDVSYNAIAQKCLSLGCENKCERITNEQIDFLIKNHEKTDWKNLCVMFNQKYKTHFSIKSLNRVCYKRGLKKFYRNKFSDEQRIFLATNIENYTYKKLTELFNQRFGTCCTQSSITQQCLMYLKIKRGDNWIAHNAAQIGEEREKYKNSKYKTKFVKIKCGLKNRRSEMWVPKHVIIWENHNNRKITDDEVVVFLDGNKENFAPENLYCITRKILSVMNLNKWFTEEREHTLVAIKWCELYYSMKKQEL